MEESKKLCRQDRWDVKNGITAKTYKVNKRVAEDFKAACKQAGVSMGPQLTAMMQEFVNRVNEQK